jgi:hypothetical protein
MSLNAKIGTFILEGWFTKYDIFDMQVSFSMLTDKSASIEDTKRKISDSVLTALRSGPSWALNPTVHDIWEAYRDCSPEEATIAFLEKNGNLIVENVDDRKNHSKISFRARIICDNVKEFISSSKSITVDEGYVQTAFFKFPLR